MAKKFNTLRAKMSPASRARSDAMAQAMKKGDAPGALGEAGAPLAPEVDSPAWHGEVLVEREAARSSGGEIPIDFEDAKRQLLGERKPK